MNEQGWVEFDRDDHDTWPPDGCFVNLVRGFSDGTWMRLYGRMRYDPGQEPILIASEHVVDDMHWPWPTPPMEPRCRNFDTIFWRVDR